MNAFGPDKADERQLSREAQEAKDSRIVLDVRSGPRYGKYIFFGASAGIAVVLWYFLGR